eukprot:s810_g3.t1
MQAGALSKVQPLEVLSTFFSDASSPSEDVKLKVWVGFLKPELMENLSSFEATQSCDYLFAPCEEDVIIPYPRSLIAAASDHFAFFTAEEEEPVDHPPPEEEGVDGEPLEFGGKSVEVLERRMTNVESVLDQVQSGLQLLITRQTMNLAGTRQEQAADLPAAPRPGAAAAPHLRGSARRAGVSGDGSPSSPMQKGRYPNLDPGVVQAALQAGIPSSQLQQMERVVMQNAKARRTGDVHRGLRIDPLSEDDGYAGDPPSPPLPGGETSPPVRDPMMAAVERLASIMEVLTEDKRKRASSSKLDVALDGAHSSSSEGLSLGGGKKSAAARRLLRSTLQDHPEEIYLQVERLMFEDLNSQTLMPGLEPRGLSARGWIEFRSKIGSFKTAAYAAWSIGGILDALISDNVALARARACLGLLQIDQCSIDRGSWLLSSELSLEQGPPLTAMGQHVPPDPVQGDAPFSKLLDPRWAEVTLGHLRDQDDYLSRRRNLGKQNYVGKTNDASDQTDAKQRPKGKAKPKAGPGEKEDA